MHWNGTTFIILAINNSARMSALQQSAQKSAFDIVMCIKCIFIIFVIFKFIDTIVCFLRSPNIPVSDPNPPIKHSSMKQELAEENETDVSASQSKPRIEDVPDCIENGKSQVFQKQILTNYNISHTESIKKRSLDVSKKGRVSFQMEREERDKLMNALSGVGNESIRSSFRYTMQSDLCPTNHLNCHQILSF